MALHDIGRHGALDDVGDRVRVALLPALILERGLTPQVPEGSSH